MKNNEYFLLLPYEPKDTLLKFECERYLSKLNGVDFVKDHPIISYMLNNYNIKNPDFEKQIKIGPSFKGDRVCRFCKKSQPETTFNKKAHAISEALGNKNIILNNECDKCNEFFSKIEQDFIMLNNLERTYFKIYNKQNKTPTLTTCGNETISWVDTHLEMKFKEENVSLNENGSPKSCLIEIGKYIPQNVYKTLCKFALSILDNEYLKHFNRTIDWLLGNVETHLPMVFRIYKDFSIEKMETNMVLYIRKTDNTDLPYLIGEFNIACWKYMFIVPFCDKDTNDFLNNDLLEKLETIFPYFSKQNKYGKINCTNNKPVPLRININFVQNDNLE